MTGRKALFCNRTFTEKINELEPHESDAVLGDAVRARGTTRSSAAAGGGPPATSPSGTTTSSSTTPSATSAPRHARSTASRSRVSRPSRRARTEVAVAPNYDSGSPGGPRLPSSRPALRSRSVLAQWSGPHRNLKVLVARHPTVGDGIVVIELEPVAPVATVLDTNGAVERRWRSEFERGAQLRRHPPPEVLDRRDGHAVGDDGLDERIVDDRVAHHAHRHRPGTDHVTELATLGLAAPVRVERADEHDIGPGARALPVARRHRHERIGGVCLARFGAALTSRHTSDPVGLGVETVHERDADLGRQPELSGDHPPPIDPVPNRSRDACCSRWSSSRSLDPSTTRRDASRKPAIPDDAATSRSAASEPGTAASATHDLPSPAPTTLALTRPLHSSPDTLRRGDRRSIGRACTRRGARRTRHPLDIASGGTPPPRRGPHPRCRTRLLAVARAPRRSPRSPRPSTDPPRTPTPRPAARQQPRANSPRPSSGSQTHPGRKVIDARPSRRPHTVYERTFVCQEFCCTSAVDQAVPKIALGSFDWTRCSRHRRRSSSRSLVPRGSGRFLALRSRADAVDCTADESALTNAGTCPV